MQPSCDVSALGATFGRWLLLARLGDGASAEVFLARDAAGRLAALKRLHAPLCDDTAAVRALLDEARLAARVRSNRVPAPLDVGCVDGRYYAAFAHVAGRDLARAIRVRPLGSGEAALVIADVCEALAALEAAGAAHGDVSPANVRIGVDGETSLLDLGLALRAAPGPCGTAGFRAPERESGGRATAAADVWSAGALLACLAPGDPGLGALAAAARAGDPAMRPRATALAEVLRARAPETARASLASLAMG